MLEKLASALLGRKALIGFIVAAGCSLLIFAAQWQNALEAKAAAKSEAKQYRQSLLEAELQVQKSLTRQRQLERALAEKQREVRSIRTQAKRAEQALTELEASNDKAAAWSSHDIPDSIRRWLHNDYAAGRED